MSFLVPTTYTIIQVLAIQMLNSKYISMRLNSLCTHDHICLISPGSDSTCRRNFDLINGSCRDVCLEVDPRNTPHLKWHFDLSTSSGRPVHFQVHLVGSNSLRHLCGNPATPNSKHQENLVETVCDSHNSQVEIPAALGERVFVCFRWHFANTMSSTTAFCSFLGGCLSQRVSVQFEAQLLKQPTPDVNLSSIGAGVSEKTHPVDVVDVAAANLPTPHWPDVLAWGPELSDNTEDDVINFFNDW